MPLRKPKGFFLFLANYTNMNISRGSDTTLKATTLESRFLEAFYLLTTKISNIAEVTVNWDVNLPELQTSISYQLPAVHTNEPSGFVGIRGVDVLGDLEFQPGDGGQFVSTHLIGQLVEMIYLGQTVEIAQSTNESVNRISANFDSDEQYISGAIVLPIAVEANDAGGFLQLKATKFLN